MKRFTVNGFDVQEFCPMMDNYFDDMNVEEMARLVEQMEKSQTIFSKKIQNVKMINLVKMMKMVFHGTE